MKKPAWTTRRQGDECQVVPMFCRTRRTRPFLPLTGSEKNAAGRIERATRPIRVGFGGSAPFFVFLWKGRKMSRFMLLSGQRFHGRVDDGLRRDRRAAGGVDALHALLLEDGRAGLGDGGVVLLLVVLSHPHVADLPAGHRHLHVDGPGIPDAVGAVLAVWDLFQVQAVGDLDRVQASLGPLLVMVD